MNLRIASAARPDATRRVLNLTRERARWKYVGFEVVRLAAGQSVERDTRDREACLVWLSGMSTVSAGEEEWSRVGGRESPFDGPPAAVYVPPATRVRVRALDAADIAIGWAPAERGASARLLEVARVEQRGEGVMSRTIHQILMEDREAERMIGAVKAMITTVRNVRAERGFTPKERFKLYVLADVAREGNFFSEYSYLLMELARLSEVVINGQAPAGVHHDVVEGFAIGIEFPERVVTQEQIERTQREIEKTRKELASVEAKLANEQFVRNAPAAVVEQTQARHSELRARIEKLQQNQ